MEEPEMKSQVWGHVTGSTIEDPSRMSFGPTKKSPQGKFFGRYGITTAQACFELLCLKPGFFGYGVYAEIK